MKSFLKPLSLATFTALAFALNFSLMTAPAFAKSAAEKPEIGKPAPEFSLVDTNGKTHTLKEHKGQVVVLEWLNFECPFVKKHYESGNMQKLQAEETKNGIVWLSVVSSRKDKQGYYEPKEMNARKEKEKSAATAIVYDTDGKVGKAYHAKTTPHMYVIDSTGTLVYKGGIDDKPSTDVEDIATAKNYVKAALEDIRAKRKVAVSDTNSYGCGVKY